MKGTIDNLVIETLVSLTYSIGSEENLIDPKLQNKITENRENNYFKLY
jgi:hypothetical protein